MPELVRITDVSPRDGLQNEPGIIPTGDKVQLVRMLMQTGVDEVEVTSFVSRKWVPQLGDAGEVFQALAAAEPPAAYPLLSALVPNERGLEGLLDVNRAAGRRLVGKVSVFTAASETFALRNTNASIAETLERFEPVVRRARAEGLATRGYVSCAIACPFEGPIDPARVAEVASRLLDLGVSEVDLGDTIGAGTPESVRVLLEHVHRLVAVRDRANTLTLHLHDTFGRAAACVREALRLGVRSFDGSVSGLGGCPYAAKKLPDGTTQRAPGNISTETLVRTIHDAGLRTNVDLDALEQAAALARAIVTDSRSSADGGGAS
ncbi:MAG: hydroxymethylglutaryl-CoA lyase [Phycisphaerales bacterium]